MVEIKNSIFVFEKQFSTISEDFTGIAKCAVCLEGKYDEELSRKVTIKAFWKKRLNSAFLKKTVTEENKEEKYKEFEEATMNGFEKIPKSFTPSELDPIEVMSYMDKYDLDKEEKLNVQDCVFGDVKCEADYFDCVEYESRAAVIEDKIEALKEELGYIPDDLFILYY